MPQPRNVLLIVCDQLRFDCMGPARFQPTRTPHLDALEASGMAFDAAFTPTPLCCPARQAMLSGARPETFGSLWNYDQGLPANALEPDRSFWPARLAEAGYRTGHVGKWHVHPTKSPRDFGLHDEVLDADYLRFRGAKHGEARAPGGWLGGTDPVPLEDSMTHWYAERAMELLDKYAADPDGRPWLLRLDFHEPHLPCCPAEPFASRTSAADARKWPSLDDDFANKPYIQQQNIRTWKLDGMTWVDWAPAVARYMALIEQMDDAIGRLLARLEARGLADDTVVVFTTDHGDMGGGHRMIDKHYVMYDDIVRVPLVVRWPGVTPAGARSDAFVLNMTDLAMTLLRMLDPAAPEIHDARALQPLLDGAPPPADWRDAVVSTYNGQQFGLYTQRMLRDRRWKYVWNLTDVDELYDMQEDPAELVNRIDDPALRPMLATMRERLWHELESWGDYPPKSPWLRAQLLEGRK